MPKKVFLSIARDKTTREYKVLWREGSAKSKPIESKTYYTDDLQDAVLTLIGTIKRATKRNLEVSIKETSTTRSLLDKFLESSRGRGYSSLLEEIKDYPTKLKE